MEQENNRVYHKAPNGTVYVYEVVANYWDKQKKQPRNRQVCIGKLDPANGELIPSKRLDEGKAAALDPVVTAKTTVSGPRMVLSMIADETGLASALRKAFPDNWKQVMSLAWYMVSTSGALSHAEAWCRNHEVLGEKPLNSQRISELLSRMSEDERQTFFSVWGRQVSEKDYLCYDITSVSSYSKGNEFVRYGYNRDHEQLPQVNLAMVYGQKSFLPVAYRLLPGSITDVSTLPNLLDSFDKLEFPRMHLVMDRGFYSRDNVDLLVEGRHNFTIGVPAHLKWAREEIDRARDVMYGPDGYRKVDDEVLYVNTRLIYWGEEKRRCYAQLYFNAKAAAEDYDGFTRRLLDYRQELEQSRPVAEHEEAYRQFFLCRETPKRGLKVDFNDAAIEASRNRYAGFFLILTTKFKDPLEALSVYRQRDIIEKCFDDLKNDLDARRLRVHTPERMRNRLFIQFIALIFMSRIRKAIQDKLPDGGYSAKTLLQELDSLTTIHYAGRYKDRLSEVSKAQREILQAFDIDPHA